MTSYLKAIVGAIIAGLGALGAVLVGDVGFADVTAGQWVTVATVTLTAFAGVWATPNTPQS